MIEVAICLAIVSFALLALLASLPISMNTQRDNREETLINQDVTVLLEAIRSGARGADDLTNYVYAITNTWQQFDNFGQPIAGNNGVQGYTFTAAFNNFYLTNGARIIGLLGTPEFSDGIRPIPSISSGGYSNHVVAYVRSISGLASDKPPQDNAIMVGDAFAYRMVCVNAPVAVDTNIFSLPPKQRVYADQLNGNLRELRLTFRWPQLPNGNVGNGRQTYRATVAGSLAITNDNGQLLYFFQSHSFTNAP